MTAVSTVSPAETMNWSGQRNAAQQNLLGSKAQNLYQRQLSEMDFSRNVGDFNRGADQQRLKVPTQFAQSGMLQSGLYRNALQRYAQERLSGLNALQTQFQAQNGGMVLEDRGAEDTYAQDLMRILAEQYARQATTATQIGGWS